MNQRTLLATATALSLAIASGSALALDAVSIDVPQKRSGGFVGLGVGYVPDYEGSDDYEAVPAPFGQYRWASGRYVDLGGTQGAEHAARLTVNIVSTDTSSTWEFGPILQYRLKRDDVDNSQVDNMKEVDGATEAGAFLGLNIGPWSAELAAAADVSDEHDGYLVYLNGKYELPINDKFMMHLGAHVTYADSDYMDTYFGVSNNNRGTSTLPNYRPDSGLKDAGLNVTGIYHFNDKWGLAGNIEWTRMLNDAEDSPLVDGRQGVGDENQFGAVLAVTYSF